MQLRVTTDYVPAVVPASDLFQFFDSYHPRLHFSIARVAPLIAVKIITGGSTDSAATTLGYKTHHLDAVSVLNESFATADAKRTFLNDCRQWLQHLNDRPVNYGHRRRFFNHEWLLTEKDWKALQRSLLRANRATRGVVHRRHRHYSVWVWSLVTSSYARHAPMIETAEARAADPDHGAMGFMNKVKHSRSGDQHFALVEDFAARLATRIDETAPTPPNEEDRPLGQVA